MNAIGFIELTSIARGIEATDHMLKAAQVEVLASHPICAGKYVTLIAGDVADVNTAISVGIERAGHFLVDKLVLPNVHPDVYPAISGAGDTREIEALGVIETFVCASCIVAADIVAKAGQSRILYLRLGMGLGGKAYLTFTGDIGSVEASMQAALRHFSGDDGGAVAAHCIIPRPHARMAELVL